MKQRFDVTGMSCSACSAHVEKAVSRVPGIDTVQVNLLQNSMTVEYADGAVDENYYRCGDGSRVRCFREGAGGQKSGQ